MTSDYSSRVKGVGRASGEEGGSRKSGKRREDSLDQSIMDIIHSPSTIPQMSTNRMSEVIGLHDGSEGVHKSFKTTVD